MVSAATTAAVANLCAPTAAAIWKERNEENEAWIDSIPALRERKRKTGKNMWKYKAQKADRAPRKRNRISVSNHDRSDPKHVARSITNAQYHQLPHQGCLLLGYRTVVASLSNSLYDTH